MEKSKKGINYNLIIICILAIVFILIFSTSTSPLYINYEDDSAIFITVGKMLVNGKVLYTDIFDHKGPVFFFIEYLGQIISYGKNGILILQILSLIVTNYFLDKLIQLKFSKKISLITIICGIPILSSFFEEGNLTEEFSLPFISIGLYIGFKWYNTRQYDKKIYCYAFFLGVLFTIIAFIRLNNAIALTGLVLGLLIVLLNDKKYLEIIKCAEFFLFGLVIVSIIVLVYFIIHNNVYEMLYATFIYNFIYNASDFIFSNCVAGLFFVFLLLIINIRNKNINVLIWIIAILSVTMGFIGRGFKHYYMINYPLILILLSMFIDNIKKYEKMERMFIILVLFFILCSHFLISIVRIGGYFRNYELLNNNKIQVLTNRIPVNERDSFLVYNADIGGVIYSETDIFPAYKYAFLQTFLFDTDSDIYDEMYNYVKGKNIKWFITQKINENNEIDDYIINNYQLIDTTKCYIINNINVEEKEFYLYKLMEK